MTQIFIKAISLVLIIAIGYGIKQLKWVSYNDFPKFSKVALYITLPCALATNFNTFNINFGLMFLVAVGILTNIIQQLTAYFLNRKKGSKEKAFSIFNSSSYNIGAFAMPYISGFAGSFAIIIASIFDIGNSIAAAGIGYGFGMAIAKDKENITPMSFIKSMFSSPIFDTYLFLLIFRLLKLHFPSSVITFTSTVGNANTFMAMLMIGIGLELKLNKDKLKTALKFLVIRYGFSIVFTIITLFILPFSKDIKMVLCMLYFAPLAAMISGFTSEAGADVETSAFMTSVSIIIGIVVMPIVLIIMRT